MNKTALKLLLRTVLANACAQGGGSTVMVRLGLLALPALLAYLGVDTANLFEDDIDGKT